MNTKPTALKLFAWNVNGLRAVIKKDALRLFLETYSPDILCMGETKISEPQIEEENIRVQFPNYTQYYSFAAKKGYSGTAIWVKNHLPPTLLPLPDPLNEGRLTALEFPNFLLVSVYVPNTKDDLSRLDVRQHWDKKLVQSLNDFSQQYKKPLIICGDMNVAHTPLDLARPKPNEGKHGYTKEERSDFSTLLTEVNLLDSFRIKHPTEIKYSWWSHWGRARQTNVGWRIDYFLIENRLESKLISADIHPEVLGSDHCPISIELAP